MIVNNKLHANVNRVPGIIPPAAQQRTVQLQSGFDQIFQDKIEKNYEIKFSKHAEMRMQTRNIHLSQMQKDKLTEAVNRAELKGINDTLVLMDSVAFVVNVKNRTVITAVDSSELKKNIFTNIDGAVFA